MSAQFQISFLQDEVCECIRWVLTSKNVMPASHKTGDLGIINLTGRMYSMRRVMAASNALLRSWLGQTFSAYCCEMNITQNLDVPPYT